MKKKTIFSMMFATLAGIFCSCGSDDEPKPIFDVAPINFMISIETPDGTDLLDAAYQDNLLNRISVEYKESTYKAVNNTRAYMPQFEGLVLRKNYTDNTFSLLFGEFPGDISANEEITLYIDSTKVGTLSFTNSFAWIANTPVIDRHFFYNGEEIPSGSHELYRFQYSEGTATLLK